MIGSQREQGGSRVLVRYRSLCYTFQKEMLGYERRRTKENGMVSGQKVVVEYMDIVNLRVKR
jgi:hypothetical protein